VYIEDTKELLVNIFGVKSSFSYSVFKVANNVEELHGFDFDGRYVFLLAKDND